MFIYSYNRRYVDGSNHGDDKLLTYSLFNRYIGILYIETVTSIIIKFFHCFSFVLRNHCNIFLVNGLSTFYIYLTMRNILRIIVSFDVRF